MRAHTHTHKHTHIFVRIFDTFFMKHMNLVALQMVWSIGSLHYLAKVICHFLSSSLSHRTWPTLGSTFACAIADVLLKVCTSQLYNHDLSQVQLVVLSLVLPYQMMMSWCRNPDCVWPVSWCNLLSNPETCLTVTVTQHNNLIKNKCITVIVMYNSTTSA